MTTVPPGSRVATAVGMLRARHERVTPARLAVLEVLDSTVQHLSADDIVELVAGRAATVHRATVYRALSTLAELELVTHTHVGGSAAIYHLAVPELPVTSSDSSLGAHAHLQCTTCGKVIDAPIDVLEPLSRELDRQLGFQLHPQHAALLGVCADCRRLPASMAGDGPGG